MKRILYALGPVVLVLTIVIASGIGDKTNILFIQKKSEWRFFLEPNIWHRGLTQALWTSQVAGGFLISAGDTVYSHTNVQWSALVLVSANVVSTWAGIFFWFGISGNEDNDASTLAVLIQIYNAVKENEFHTMWPLFTFAVLFFSGMITMLTILYPIYDRFRRTRVRRWRLLAAASSVVGLGATLAVLAQRLTALDLLEDIAVPLLVSLTTFLEISAFVFIYGWKVLVEDVEFLTGNKLKKCWVLGWCAVPGIMTPFTLWWIITLIKKDPDWTEPPLDASTLLATLGLVLVTFTLLAAVSVARQVQYDFIGKLKSSFKPSRHWGPRDPISHYYWLARREQAGSGDLPQTAYHRRELGYLSGRPSFFNVSDTAKTLSTFNVDVKKRANSDDVMYTVYRKEYLNQAYRDYFDESRKRRSKSADWVIIPNVNRSRTNFDHTRLQIKNVTAPSDLASAEN